MNLTAGFFPPSTHNISTSLMLSFPRCLTYLSSPSLSLQIFRLSLATVMLCNTERKHKKNPIPRVKYPILHLKGHPKKIKKNKQTRTPSLQPVITYSSLCLPRPPERLPSSAEDAGLTKVSASPTCRRSVTSRLSKLLSRFRMIYRIGNVNPWDDPPPTLMTADCY